MILNNFREDVNSHMKENGLSYRKLAAVMGTYPANLSRITSPALVNRATTAIINNTYVEMFDTMGYDIKVEYIPKPYEEDSD